MTRFWSVFLSLSLITAACDGWLFSRNKAPTPDWTGLRAGFGAPFQAFKRLPRQESEAKADGWVKDSSVGCTVQGSKFSGNRYIKDGDKSAMLLFDINGYIAGIQAGIPKSRRNFPYPQNERYHVYLEEDDAWVTTAYFIDPAKICTTGRTKSQFEAEGTGTMLSIQIGNSSDHVMTMPKQESDLLPQTAYTQGRCFPWMGMHYWYNLSKSMSCDEMFPMFLLYNNGQLNAFGWAFDPKYDSSSRWEHPKPSQFGHFMKEPPTCLGSEGAVTTLHVYLTDNPYSNFC